MSPFSCYLSLFSCFVYFCCLTFQQEKVWPPPASDSTPLAPALVNQNVEENIAYHTVISLFYPDIVFVCSE